jgi:hypothetical protein
VSWKFLTLDQHRTKARTSTHQSRHGTRDSGADDDNIEMLFGKLLVGGQDARHGILLRRDATKEENAAASDAASWDF